MTEMGASGFAQLQEMTTITHITEPNGSGMREEKTRVRTSTSYFGE